VIGGLVALAGAAGLLALFLASDPDRGRPAPAGSSSTPPPIQLGLRDGGSAVTLTWNDPSGGKVPFVVAYGRADGPADRNQRLPAGTTTVTINGLNPRLDYCFTVAGIESTTAIALSHAVCTRRGASTGPS
jgi:Fibronectin type III domain